MAVDYLKDYLGVDPSDYSAMERGIAGISPVGKSIVPRMGVIPSRLPMKPLSLSDLPSLPFRNIERTPTPDFGSQITGLEEQIAQLMEQMQALESEKLDALNQQDTMRAELAQSQQDALAAQAEEFSGVKTNLEQQIADLTAQIGNMQAPVDVPPPVDDMRDVPPIDAPPVNIPDEEPTSTPAVIVFGPDGTMYSSPAAARAAGVTNYTMRPPGALPFTPKPSIGGVGGRDLEDRQIIERRPPITPPLEDRGFGPGIRRSEDFFRPEELMPLPPPPSITERPIIERPLIRGLENKDTMNDFMSIERLPDERDKRFLMPEPIAPVPPRIPPMPPRPRPGPVPVPQPINPMLPPQRTMSRPMMGGARGGFSGSMRPMMMRASGGTISQAIADLQNRFNK